MSGTMHPLERSDCWNSIGVAGDQSCPKLVEHIHCRNCEVYAGAAQRNLQRPVGPGYREDWAEQLRQPESARVVHDNSGLAFRIGREWLMLPTRIVNAVAPLAPSHTLPHRASAALKGIVNVGGTLTPAISLGALLGIDEHDAPAREGRHTFSRLLVIAWEEQRYALALRDFDAYVLDFVQAIGTAGAALAIGIVRYAGSSIKAPAATMNKGLLRCLTGVISEGELRIGVLDAPLIGHQLARLLR